MLPRPLKLYREIAQRCEAYSSIIAIYCLAEVLQSLSVQQKQVIVGRVSNVRGAIGINDVKCARWLKMFPCTVDYSFVQSCSI